MSAHDDAKLIGNDWKLMSGLEVKQLKTRLKVLFEEGIDLFGIAKLIRTEKKSCSHVA